MTIDYNIEIALRCHVCESSLEAYRKRNDDWMVYPCEPCKKDHETQIEELKTELEEKK